MSHRHTLKLEDSTIYFYKDNHGDLVISQDRVGEIILYANELTSFINTLQALNDSSCMDF